MPAVKRFINKELGAQIKRDAAVKKEVKEEISHKIPKGEKKVHKQGPKQKKLAVLCKRFNHLLKESTGEDGE